MVIAFIAVFFHPLSGHLLVIASLCALALSSSACIASAEIGAKASTIAAAEDIESRRRISVYLKDYDVVSADPRTGKMTLHECENNGALKQVSLSWMKNHAEDPPPLRNISSMSQF